MSGDAKVIPVKVALRGRPLIPKECSEGCQCCLQFMPGESQVILGRDKAFTFDYVFPSEGPQCDVYDAAVSGLVKGLFKGYNATVLAYGQTGSGKTYTMGGSYCMDCDEKMGIIPRVIQDLFAQINENTDFDLTVRVSYMELYKEDLMDLLVPQQKRDRDVVQIREDPNGGIMLTGLTDVLVTCAEEMSRCLELGSQGRTTGATAMNSTSSRSHAIFTIILEKKSKTDEQDFCRAKFHLVDLAGSERAKKTRAEGDRFKEGVQINKGLLALGNVISALGEDGCRRGHIPYRDSKLTRLLQDSLGGNSHTVMIACVSPADSNMEETLSTLRYADRARKIKNKPVVNRDPQAAEILRLRNMVQDLQSQMVQSGKAPMMNVSDISDTSIDMKTLTDRYKELKEENCKLSEELRTQVDQNSELMERNILLELRTDKLKQTLHVVKQKTGMSISRLETTKIPEDDPEESDGDLHHISMLKEIHEKITETELDQSRALVDLATENLQSDTSQGEGDGEEADGDEQPNEQKEQKHLMRRAQLQRDLQELNNRLLMKEDLVAQMSNNEDKMMEMRQQFKDQMTDLEKEVEKLAREREDLQHALEKAKTNPAATKVSEQRRKRLQELEGQLQALKKKMTDQAKMLKLKDQAEKQMTRLNDEISSMKGQRVKMMKQLRQESENFRKMKAEKDKEVMQLKAKDRKRELQLVKLEQKNERQKAVLQRKTEEAAAAMRRLKESLGRQKAVQTERERKQETSDTTGIGTRVRKWLSHELEVAVDIEEVKHCLEGLKNERTDLTKQMSQVKHKLEEWSSPGKRRRLTENNDTTIDEEKEKLEKQLTVMKEEIAYRSAQIRELQQRIMDAEPEEKARSRWSSVHTMMEAKCALKYLLNEAVTAKLTENRLNSKMSEIRLDWELASASADAVKKELKDLGLSHEHELHELNRKHEHKILYLLNQLNNTSDQVLENTQDEDLRKRLHFQEKEIGRLTHLEEQLESKTKICEELQKEVTKLRYQMTRPDKDSSLMPSLLDEEDPDSTKMRNSEDLLSDSKFFSPAILHQTSSRLQKPGYGRDAPVSRLGGPGGKRGGAAPGKRTTTQSRTQYVSESEAEEEEDEDEDEDSYPDPDWESGRTPGQRNAKTRRKTTFNLRKMALSTSNDSTDNNDTNRRARRCQCTSGCTTKRCSCHKEGAKCSAVCVCRDCQNRDDDQTATLNTTFDVGQGGESDSLTTTTTSTPNTSNKENSGLALSGGEGASGARKRPSEPDADAGGLFAARDATAEGGLAALKPKFGKKRKLLSVGTLFPSTD